MFAGPFEKRLSEWNQFKKQLEHDPEPFWAVQRVYDDASITMRSSDPWDSDTWPDPWTLIKENDYDEFLVALGIAYTLILTERFQDEPISIMIGRSADTSIQYVVLVDGYYINWNRTVYSEDQIPETLTVEKLYNVKEILGSKRAS